MDLLETSRLMRTQNNRATQYPLFIIQEEQEVVKADGRGDRVVYWNGGDQTSMTAEQYEVLEDAERKDELDEAVKTVLEEVGLDELSDFEPDDWERLEVSDEWVYRDDAGVFFTEAACELHIRQNHYHYKKPRSYAISAWRNYEMQEVMKMILKLTGEDIPNHYQ